MYRHLAESIKENDNKQFISKSEVDMLNSYENTLREKKDTYTKQELQDFINEFGVVRDRLQGSNLIVSNTRKSHISNVEIHGNTLQNPSKVSDIRSVGDRLPDGRYKIPVVCTGKNLFDKSKAKIEFIEAGTGNIIDSSSGLNRSSDWIKCSPNTKYVVSGGDRNRWLLKNNFGKITYIGSEIGDGTPTITTLDDTVELKCYVVHRDVSLLDNIQIEVGDTPTSYEPYCEYRTDIILDEPLDRLGNFSDKIFNNDGTWTVEKHICNEYISGNNDWRRHGTIADGTMLSYKCELPLSKPSDGVVLRREDSCVSDRFRTVGLFVEGSENIFIDAYSILYMSVLPTSLASDNITEFKKYIDANPMNLKYVLNSPKLIPLPDNQQVKLRSFEGITHIHFDCNLNGEIVCDLPRSKKSILDSVSEEINSLNTELELIENMENGTKTTVSTYSHMVSIENTSNGYIDDIKMEGETLVDIKRKHYGFSTPPEEAGKYTKTTNDNGIEVTIHEKCENWAYFIGSKIPRVMKPNTTYTVFIGRHKNLEWLRICTGNAEIAGSPVVYLPLNETTNGKYLLKTNSNIDTLINKRYDDTYLYFWTYGNVGHYVLEDVMIIEGDHTDKPLSYFEGLKSAGDGVDSISLTSNNANLLDINKLFNNTGPHYNCTSSVNGNVVTITNTVSTGDSYTNTGIVTGGSVPVGERQFAIPVEEGKTYKYSRYVQITELFEASNNRSSEYISFVDKNYNLISLVGIEHKGPSVTIDKTYNEFEVKAPKGAKYMMFRVGIRAKAVCEYSDMEIKEVSSLGDKYLPHKSDTKQLFIKNSSNEWVKPVLRSTPNRVKDTIDKQSDGKYYFTKRCDEMVLDGSEGWEIHGNVTVNGRTTVVLPFKGVKNIYSVYDINLHCDKLRPICRDDIENLSNSISFHANKYVDSSSYNAWISLTIDNSLLTSSDVDGVKGWLATNTPIVVMPTVDTSLKIGDSLRYECSPIDLQTYDGNTYLHVNTGIVNPNIKATVSSDIGSTLQRISEKVSTLESQIVDNYVFDSIILLQSIYSTDIANLQLDMATFRERELFDIKYDDDLYKLLREVVVFGRESLDDLYLETVIDFYTMIDKISFEMADELFDLLYADESYIEE